MLTLAYKLHVTQSKYINKTQTEQKRKTNEAYLLVRITIGEIWQEKMILVYTIGQLLVNWLLLRVFLGCIVVAVAVVERWHL